MKLTKKQIDIIRANTPAELRGSSDYKIQDILGTYQKCSANWSYKAGYIKYNGASVLVVTAFGEII